MESSVGKLSIGGELEWLKDFGGWEEIITASLLSGKRPKLIGSVKEKDWKVFTFNFDSNGNFLGKENIAEGVAFMATLWSGMLVLAGYQGRDLWVWSEGEVTIPNGAATSLLPLGDGLLVGGEVEGTAFLMELDSRGKSSGKSSFGSEAGLRS
ncbi:hypothetical protein [Thermococcus stetteri]|uniref:hypothetical protein n=1 Tax=Thermococcus stetteri TaxID=49900 RepID=UPI001FD72D27|nr:hypothetical protein [Thermococcus stetteri]MBP1912391.1 hypothetical protein [Thermococcus stetteri]